MAWVALAFAAGIALNLALPLPASGIGLGLIPVGIPLLRNRRGSARINLFLLLLIGWLGMARAGMAGEAAGSGIGGWIETRPRPVTLTGTLVSDLPMERARGRWGWFRVEAPAGRLWVRFPARAGELRYGERLRLSGLLRAGSVPGPGRFDERRWLWLHGGQGILTVADPEALLRLGAEPGPWVRYRRWVAGFRAQLEQIGRSLLSGGGAAYLEGLVLGQPGIFEDPAREAFRRTGTLHVLVVSGLHVGLIGFIMLTVLTILRLPRGMLYGALAGILATYCVLTGMKVPIVRSTLTGLLFCWGKGKGWPVSALNLTGAAAFVILALEPRALADVSFQLSFAAVGGIFTIGSWLSSRLLPALRWRPLTEAVGVSCGAWIATLPFLAWHFHLVSWVGPLANLVVVPWASLAIAVGLALYGAALLWPPAAGPFAASFEWLTAGLRAAVRWMASPAWSCWQM